MKNLYVIMGMHRSGTSLTAQLLNKMGVWLGTENQMLSRSQYNEKGYWELQELVQMDDIILCKSKSLWCSIKKPVLDTKLIQMLVPIFEKKYLNNDNINMAIKDPRLTIVWKAWIDAMKYKQRKIKGIVVVRNPLEVAESLYKRDGMQQEYALCLWYRYNWECLLFSMEYESVWISYNEYFEDIKMVWKKIGTFVGGNDGIREEKLYDIVDGKIRHFTKLGEEIKTEVEKKAMSLYISLLKLCNNEININDVINKHLEEYQTIYAYGSELIFYNPIEEMFKKTYLYSVVRMLDSYGNKSLKAWMCKQHKPVVLCGNGRNLEYILPFFEKNFMQVDAICDKKNFTSRKYLNTEISVISYDELQHTDNDGRIYLITAFGENEEGIFLELAEKTKRDSVYRLSSILLEDY